MASPPADLVPLVPGVRLVEADLPDFSVRGALITGTHRTILWDTLATPASMEALDGAVDHPTLTVVYSHGDWDHVWGTSGLTLPIAEIISHPLCAHRFEAELPATLEAMAKTHPGLYRPVSLVPPTTFVDSGTSIPLGGLTLELQPMPGHTPDTLVGFIPEAGVFLGGDAVETPLPFLNEESPLEEWKRELERWATRLEAVPGGAHVVPSHGPVASPELLRNNARYLSDLLSGTEPAIPGGLTPFYQETHQNNLVLARDR